MKNILFDAFYYDGDKHDNLIFVAPKYTNEKELIKLFRKHYKSDYGNIFNKEYIYSIDIFQVRIANDLEHEYKIKLERIK